MSEPVILALIGLLGAGGIGGVWVELVKTRKAVGSNGGSSLHDGVRRIEKWLRDIDGRQREHSERIARLETSMKHLKEK